ncbi:MAG: SH3 domain-containing protein [Gammaproteobacteria bacterium]|nr:SH3 domain-containing protein [Gammaproteobacteria bacterium]
MVLIQIATEYDFYYYAAMIRCLIIAFLFAALAGCATQNIVSGKVHNTPQDARYFANRVGNFPHINAVKEKAMTRNYLQHYFAPWYHPSSIFSPKKALSQEHKLVNHFMRKPGWAENKVSHSRFWVHKLVANMRLKNFAVYYRAAVSIRSTDIRELPTVRPSFTNIHAPGHGYPFDDLQTAFLAPNVPVSVLYYSRDKVWALIETPYKALGWVKANDLAYVSRSFANKWSHHKFIVATCDHKVVIRNSRRAFFAMRIGQILPLLKRHHNYFIAYVAVANQYQHAVLKKADVSGRCVRIFPLPLTLTKLAVQMNRLMATPYGWDGLYGDRDCAVTIRDLFMPFGLWLPQFTYEQIKQGRMLSMKHMTAQQKLRFIVRNGVPFLTLISRHGHMMLYVGNVGGRPYMFHNPWGVRTINYLHPDISGRAVLGRAVIVPVDYDSGYLNVRSSSTTIEAVDRIVILTPR